MCVRVCVCVRESERVRVRERCMKHSKLNGAGDGFLICRKI